MALPSAWTDWSTVTVWKPGTTGPSDWTDWINATVWKSGTYIPSDWTAWVSASVAAATAWRKTPAGWIQLATSSRRTPTGWQPFGHSVEELPPVVDPSEMMVGMSIGSGTEANWVSVEAEWGGARSGIQRSYSSGMPTTAPTIVQQDFGKRATWHSIKSSWTGMAAGNDDAAVTSFLNSIPADHDLMLTYAHEPENDNPLGEEVTRSAQWRAAQAHFYDLVKSVRPQTLVGPVLMDWTFNAGSGRVWSRWVPPVGKMDFFGLDPYQPYKFPIIGAPNTWHNWPSADVVKWQAECDRLGVPGAIGETACHEDQTGIGPSRKVGWMNDAIAYSKAHNHVAFCYFNVYKPGDTAELMLLDSSTQSLSAWAAILAANQKGVKGATKLALIGDSLTEWAVETNPHGTRQTATRAVLQGAGFASADTYWYGKAAKQLVAADTAGKTTVQNIADARAMLGKVNLWVVALGTNNTSDGATTFATRMRTVLDAIYNGHPDEKVVWVNVSYYNGSDSRSNTYNPVIASVIAEYPNARVADWHTYIHRAGVYNTADWAYPTDSVHLTAQGYAKRDQFIATVITGGTP